MKKIILSIVFLFSLQFVTTGPVLAVGLFDESCSAASTSQFCRSRAREDNRTLVFSQDSLLIRIARTIIYITGAVSVIMIIIGGFRYVISNGDTNGLQGAKNTILYALIGLLVAVFSQIIVAFVLSRFK